MRIFHNPNIDFMKWRWHALVLSALVLASGIATVVARGGLPLGVDFSGGTVLQLKFDQPVNEQTVRNALPNAGDAVVQTYGRPSENKILVRLPMMSGTEEGANLEANAAQVEAALKAANVGAFRIEGKDIVGPSMGKDLQSKGIWATVASLGGLLVYIWFRFRFVFAVGAIAATVHDILVTIFCLVWFHYDFSLNIVAALLTITGYSVNDTIVVFDRVRENARTAKRQPLIEVVNHAVNQTLGRTVITTTTTALAVVALFLFGGEVLRGLAFTLLVGIITGTYSTVFIASATAIMISRKTQEPVVAQRAGKRA
jgi:preprotein translocase subunit SecF